MLDSDRIWNKWGLIITLLFVQFIIKILAYKVVNEILLTWAEWKSQKLQSISQTDNFSHFKVGLTPFLTPSI